VSSASEPHPLDARSAASCHRLDVIEFEHLSGGAAPPARAHERALTFVSLPDRASNRRGDVAGLDRAPLRPRYCIRRAPSGTELPPLELGDEGIQRSIENLGDVSTRNGMAQQLLHIPQLVVCGLGNRYLDQVALLGGLGPRALNMPWGMLNP
jgi:hypothetical protein